MTGASDSAFDAMMSGLPRAVGECNGFLASKRVHRLHQDADAEFRYLLTLNALASRRIESDADICVMLEQGICDRRRWQNLDIEIDQRVLLAEGNERARQEIYREPFYDHEADCAAS